MLNGLIMDYELTIPSMLRRAEQMYYDREIVTRLPDKSRHCHTYAQMVDRTKRLALALKRLGVETGDRVGTYSWNHYQHL